MLRDDLGDDAGADGFTALADGEAQALLHRNRGDQLHHDLDVVPGHHHLGALRQLHRSGHIGGAKIELRPIAFEERRVTAPLLLAQHIHFGLKLGVRRDAAGLAQNLPALHFLALRAPQQHPHVVPRLPLIQELPEHLNPGAGGLLRRANPHNLHLIVHLHDPALNAPRDHGAPARYGKYILHRHQKRPFDRTLRHRNVLIQRFDQLDHRGTPISLPSPSSAFKADPVMIGVLSPGNLYSVNKSRTSSSTSSSNSASSTMSALFKYTTM